MDYKGLIILFEGYPCPLEPIPLTLQLRNMFICIGTILFTRERVYLMFTQKAGLRNKEKWKKTLFITRLLT
jgi:hypothetical protein